jgi:hypothetical protein
MIWFVVSAILILSGIGWWLTSFVTYRVIGGLAPAEGAPPAVAMVESVAFWIMQWGAPLLLVGLGLVFGLVSIRSLVGVKRKQALAAELKQRGVATQGVITFIDRNYRLLVNNRPISSIVEFRFQDSAGRWHTSRKPEVSADVAIRQGWQVGSVVSVLYLPEDPTKNAIVTSVSGADASGSIAPAAQ